MGLVSSVVGMSWVGRDAAFVKEFTKFLGTLVSAYSTYMDMVIDMLVEHLTLCAFIPALKMRPTTNLE